jgi:hypothetical protein|tara:strand:- start:43 stop:675 length:633 start_codon:yes stop_codon:yes gene_type:complete
MSETLSYQEPSQPELNADEQESLQVGEQMQQEQETLLAGKYRSSEDLEKAYLELQSKLGESTEAEPEEEPQTEPEEEPEQSTEEPDTAPELTQEDVDFLQDMAGGAEEYQSMLKWAAGNLQQQEIDMYDAVMEAGDPNSVYFAVQAMVARYNDATGSDGSLLTGQGSSDASEGFRSQQELVAAMNDPRYESDPAYRSDVMQMLEQSELNF